MEIIIQFFGRLHPLLVHMPIGILFLAFAFEVCAYFSRYKRLRQAVQPMLFWGVFFSFIAAGSGYLLSQEGGYDDSLLNLHRNTGIGTAILAAIVYLIRRSPITYFKEKNLRRLVRTLLMIPLVVLLALAGHLGGSLTHGDDYLFDFSTQDSSESTPFAIADMGDVDSAVFYTSIIQPILSSKCYSCHSARKQKGQLRLDQVELIEKGGKHGAIIQVGAIDSSSLYNRLILPLEDEHHMPPSEKPQLSSVEIALVQVWIEEGANFEDRIGSLKQASRVKEYIKTAVTQTTRESLIPSDEVSVADEKTITALTSKGILVIPIGSETNYLSVSFVNATTATDDDLKLLLPLKDQLLWLNVGRTKITNEGLKIIGQLLNLTHLNLEYTSVDDAGMKELQTLSTVTSLNLVGTEVSDVGLEYLWTLKSLKKIYLFQTNVTAAGISSMMKTLPAAEVDTGRYQLPRLVTDTLVFTSGVQ